MSPNINNIDRANRIKVGALMLAIGLCRGKYSKSLLAIGLLELIEGAAGFCTATYLLNQVKKQQYIGKTGHISPSA